MMEINTKPEKHSSLMSSADVCSAFVWAYLDAVYGGKEDDQELVEQIREWQQKSHYVYGLRGLHDDILLYAAEHKKEVADVEEKSKPLRKEVFNPLSDEQRIRDSFRLYFTQFLSVLVTERMYLYYFKMGWRNFSRDGFVEADLNYLPQTRYLLQACLSFADIYPDIDFSGIMVEVYKNFTTAYIMTGPLIDPIYNGSTHIPSATRIYDGESVMRVWTLYLGKKMGYDLDVSDFREEELEPGNYQSGLTIQEQEALITKFPQLRSSCGKW